MNSNEKRNKNKSTSSESVEKYLIYLVDRFFELKSSGLAISDNFKKMNPNTMILKPNF